MPAPSIARRHHNWIAALSVAILSAVAFLPALGNGFVSWDDDKNFLANPNYRGLGRDQLHWMWTTFHLGHYVPLSWMTLGLDYQLWGMNPAGYHATNLLLHSANAVLVYFLARRLLVLATPDLDAPADRVTGAAVLAALFFAVHPLRVESVAWITERRDVLSLFFYLLGILAYLRSVQGAGARRRWYAVALAAFVCALLSKATSVTLPGVLLMLNVYPLRRLGGPAGWWSNASRRIYAGVLPFAVLSVATAALSIVALHPPAQLNVPAKIAVSSYSFVFYLWKTIAPVGLSPVYEMPQHVNPLHARFVVDYMVVVAFAALAFARPVRRRWPAAVACLAVFAAITFPMLGLVQNGPQIAADRYTYHAAPALALLVAAVYLPLRRHLGVAIDGLAVLLLAGLTTATWTQCHVWHDSESLWTRVVQQDDNSAIGHVGMANVLFARSDVDNALAHALRASEIAPQYAQAQNDVGVGLARKGRVGDAVAYYARSIALEPTFDEAHANWGVALADDGKFAEAIDHYRKALAINPDNAIAHIDWGNVLVRQGNPVDAVDHYREALRIRPDQADAEHNWGVAVARQGNLSEAIAHFRNALAINPDHAEAHDYLEKALQLLGARRESEGLGPFIYRRGR